ncbi:MAG: dTMP kinase [Dehalococcoidales bacterium]|nr:dTMP kinase [Dehalococcoidales bacterium]
MPLFITFEGGEGCGKSIQSMTLFKKMKGHGIPAVLVHEPGGTPAGERIRRLLKQGRDIPLSPLTELLLFNASRSQLVTDVILPALKAGRHVICDRYTDSTLAYQSYGRELDFNTVREINRVASQGLVPDITFLLDIPPESGLARKTEIEEDRFDGETLSFHRKVRTGFLQLAKRDQERWMVIDATFPSMQIAGIVWDRISNLF